MVKVKPTHVLLPPRPPGALEVQAALWALVHCSSTTALSALDTMRQMVGIGAVVVVVVGIGVVFSLSKTSELVSSLRAAVSGWSVRWVRISGSGLRTGTFEWYLPNY